MANKKVMLSVTASAAIASALVGTDEAEAASYKVQPGDSLWKIAQNYNTSVSKLIEVNNLKSDIIYPNQVLETAAKSSETSQKTESSSSNNSSKTTNTAGANTYTVKSGDTLSAIASKHKISLSNLMKWNGLDTTLIYPGNVFVVSDPGKSGNSSSITKPNASSSNTDASKANGKDDAKVGSTSVYTVKSGDTLSRIGLEHSVSISNLKKWNNLSSDIIYIGQKLNINGSANGGSSSANNDNGNETPKAEVNYNVDKLISVAKSFEGTKYVWGGSSPGGFDCSGFIYYVYNQAGYDISRFSSAGFFDRSFYVNKPQVGDLVFFENTYKAGISHMGIYLGGNQFIHAGSSGVQISSLSSGYWKEHFDSYKRFY